MSIRIRDLPSNSSETHHELMRTGIITVDEKYYSGPLPWDQAAAEFKSLVTGFGLAKLWSSDGIERVRRLVPPQQTDSKHKKAKT